MSQAPHVVLTQQQLENNLRLVRIGLDSTEKAIRLQLEATKQTLENSAKSAIKFSAVSDMQGALALRADLAEQATDSLMGLSRDLYELASQTQNEFAKQTEAHISRYQQTFLSSFDQFEKVSPASAEIVSSMLRSSVAAGQAAFDSLNKAARQVADFADASLRAATTATGDAINTANRTRTSRSA
ncbi:phasin family protein [Chitinimonas sp. PSY-7]|uniref:TIGR01841 family phasin n=1 Tax=Chitinimonas sp. PSY-7 TaxID=3459088 RepID=UPI00403FE245